MQLRKDTAVSRKVFENAQRDLIDDLICDLNYNNILVLKAILRSKEKLVKEVFKEYLKLCVDKHEKAFGYTRWYHNLSYLQSIGLVLLVSTKIGKHTPTGLTRYLKKPCSKAPMKKRSVQEEGGNQHSPDRSLYRRNLYSKVISPKERVR